MLAGQVKYEVAFQAQKRAEIKVQRIRALQGLSSEGLGVVRWEELVREGGLEAGGETQQ